MLSGQHEHRMSWGGGQALAQTRTSSAHRPVPSARWAAHTTRKSRGNGTKDSGGHPRSLMLLGWTLSVLGPGALHLALLIGAYVCPQSPTWGNTKETNTTPLCPLSPRSGRSIPSSSSRCVLLQSSLRRRPPGLSTFHPVRCSGFWPNHLREAAFLRVPNELSIVRANGHPPVPVPAHRPVLETTLSLGL